MLHGSAPAQPAPASASAAVEALLCIGAEETALVATAAAAAAAQPGATAGARARAPGPPISCVEGVGRAASAPEEVPLLLGRVLDGGSGGSVLTAASPAASAAASAAAAAAAAAASPTPPPTFLSSLRLPASVLDELASGSGFCYLARSGSELRAAAVGVGGGSGDGGRAAARPRPRALAAPAAPAAAAHAPDNDYDLVVAERPAAAGDDHYTLSSSGLVHYRRCGSEFTPLRQLEREYGLFHALGRIPALARFRRWKALTLWRETVRHGKVDAAAAQLATALVVLNPVLRRALTGLRSLCSEVAGWRLLRFGGSGGGGGGGGEAPPPWRDLAALAAAQRQQRAWAATSLAAFAADARALVRGACDEVLEAFLIGARIDVRAAAAAGAAGAAGSRMTYMERTALRRECRRLARFVRLADLTVRDTLLAMALDSADEVRAAVCGGGDGGSPAPLLDVDVSLVSPGGSGCWRLSPSAATVRAALHELLADAMAVVVAAPPRLVSHALLAPIMLAGREDGSDGGGGDGGDAAPQQAPASPPLLAGDEGAGSGDLCGGAGDGDLGEAVSGHARYRAVLAEVESGVDAAFAAATDGWCAQLLPYARLYEAEQAVEASREAAVRSRGTGAGGTGGEDVDGGSIGGGGDDDDALVGSGGSAWVGAEEGAAAAAAAAVAGEAAADAASASAAFAPRRSELHAAAAAGAPAIAEARVALVQQPAGSGEVTRLGAAIARLQADAAAFASMPAVGSVPPLLRLHATGLREHFAPAPARGLARLRAALPRRLRVAAASIAAEARARERAVLALSGGGDGAAAAAAALPPALPSAAWPAFARARACTEHARALARAGAAVPALRERAVGVGALASLVRAVGWPLGERVRALRRVASASLRALDAALRRGEAGSEVVAAAARSALSDAAEPQLAAAVAVARAVAAAPTLRIAPLDAPPASMLDAAADAAAAAAADAACVQLDSAATQTAALLDAAAAVHATLAELRAVAADAPRTPMPPDAALAAASALAADIAALRCLWRGLAAWHLASAACKRAPAGAQPLAEVPRHSLALDAAAQAALRTADAYEEAAAAAAGSGAGDASSALPPAAAACSWLRAQAAGLHAALPAVEALRSTELRPRHWQVLEAAFADDGGDAAAIGNTAAALAAVAPPPLAEQPLGMLLARGLLARAPQVLAIAAAARAEAELEAAVEEHVTAAWAARELTWGLAPTAEAAAAAAAAAAASPPPTVAAASAPIVLTNVDGTGGVRAALDASLAMLADTLASAACGMHLRPAAEAAQRRLALAAATLDAWLAAQRKWAALAPALADADAHMRHALPDACARFGAVDRALRALMRRTAANPNVLAAAAAKGLREALARHADTLDDVQAQLDAWRAAQAQPPQAQPASSSLA